MRLFAVVLLVCYAFASDSPPEKRYRAFKEWYGAHHEQLLFTQTAGDLAFELRYLPNEVTICQQLLQQKTVSKKQLKGLYEQYDTYDAYSFKILSPDGSDLLISQSADKAEYQEKQFYLIESVREDFRLIRDNDTLRPIHCTFENNYGTAPFVLLHLVFEKAPKGSRAERLQLLYTDQLFTSDTLVFDCRSLLHLQIPKIK
jgi:hypothetical protein